MVAEFGVEFDVVEVVDGNVDVVACFIASMDEDEDEDDEELRRSGSEGVLVFIPLSVFVFVSVPVSVCISVSVLVLLVAPHSSEKFKFLLQFILMFI